MDLPVSPVFPDTPNGRKQQMLWRQQQRLLHAGRTPPHGAADDRPPATRLDMDEKDSDDEVLPEEEETEDEEKSQLSRQSKSSRQVHRAPRPRRPEPRHRAVRPVRPLGKLINTLYVGLEPIMMISMCAPPPRRESHSGSRTQHFLLS